MAGFKSIYWANKVLDCEYGGVALTPPATVYYALMTTAPTPSGGGAEVSGGSYARVAFTNNLTNYPSASSGTKKNATAITFAAPTADWGICVGVAKYDASSSGNLITYEPFSASVTILNGAPAFVIPINAETLNES